MRSMRSMRSLRSILAVTSSRSLLIPSKQSSPRKNADDGQDSTKAVKTAFRSLRSIRSLFSASTSTAGVSTRSSVGGGQLGASSASPLLISDLPSPIRAAGFGISTAPSTADAVQEAVSLAMLKAHAQQRQEDREGCFANCYDDDDDDDDDDEEEGKGGGGEDRRSKRSSSVISISSIRGSLRSSVSSLSSTVRRHRRFSSLAPAGSSSTSRPPRLVPLIAFVSADTGRDVEEVQREFVHSLPPGTPIHGVTSAGKLLTTNGAVPGSIGCLVLCKEEEEEEEGEGEERKMKEGGDNTCSRSTACATDSPGNTCTCNFDSSSFGFATAYTADGTTATGAAELASALHAKMGSPQAIVMGTVPGAEEGIIDALERQFPGTPIWGGSAGDNKMEGDWSVLSEYGASGSGASVVAIGRDVRFGASMAASYAKPTEKRGVVTKADGRKVMEIDGQHADDWVYDWLGEDVKTEFEQGGLILDKTCRHAIGFRRPESGEIITCHLAAFGGQENWTGFDYESWVEFFAPIPQGCELIVMNDRDAAPMGYRDALVSAHREALSSLPFSAAGDEHDRDDDGDGDDAPSSPKAGILVLCGGMALATGNRLDVGLKDETFAQEVGTVPMLGLTCFGEQGYLPRARRSAQRNLSVGMLLFA